MPLTTLCLFQSPNGLTALNWSPSIRGRPFDILGGAWVIFQKKFLSLVLKEKNNLSLKRVKKNNLSLKRAKKKIPSLA